MSYAKVTAHPDEDAPLELGPATESDGSHQRRMRAHFDLRPHPRDGLLPRCPRVVAGKRCTLGNPRRTCSCKDHEHHLWDHVHFWRDTRGQTVMTLEPYGIDGEELSELVAEVRPLGLDVQIEGYSPYYPGHSVLVIIRRPTTGGERLRFGCDRELVQVADDDE